MTCDLDRVLDAVPWLVAAKARLVAFSRCWRPTSPRRFTY